MEAALYILAGLVVGAIAVYLIARNKGQEQGKQTEGLTLLQGQMADLMRTVDEKLSGSQRDMKEAMATQFGASQKLIKDITREVTEVKETNKQVVNVADQLASLQSVLQNPKQRGVLGEYYLMSTLQNVFSPGQYKEQYKFKDGEIVDAVLFVREKIIPIDSKFSLENYNRWVAEPSGAEKERLEKAFIADIKLRIAETAKYIRPSEGTMDFAFMFMPSEGTYYDLLSNKIGGELGENILQRASSKHKVIIVSPTSLLAYLQTVLQGLKALEIEEKAKDIRTRVDELGKHLARYEDYYKKLGSSLNTTVNHWNTGYKELGKVDKDVMRITESSPGLEPEVIEGPSVD